MTRWLRSEWSSFFTMCSIQIWWFGWTDYSSFVLKKPDHFLLMSYKLKQHNFFTETVTYIFQLRFMQINAASCTTWHCTFGLVMRNNYSLTGQHRGQASWGPPRTWVRGCTGGPPLWNPVWGTLWSSSQAGDQRASPPASQHLPAAFPTLEKRRGGEVIRTTYIVVIPKNNMKE